MKLLRTFTCAAFCFSTNFPIQAAEPEVIKRDENGRFVPKTAIVEKSVKSSNIGHLGTVSTGAGHGDASLLILDSLAIFAADEAPETLQVAQALAEQLSALATLHTVTIYPAGSQPKAGKLKPDLFLSLKMGSDNDELKIDLKGGNTYLGEFAADQDSDFAIFDFQFSADYKAYKPLFGRSPGLNATKAAEYFAEALIKSLNKQAEKIPVSSGFPARFYPNWVKSPTLEFLNDSAVQIGTFHGLFTKNATNWVMQTSQGPAEFLPKLVEDLTKDGWKKERLLLQDEGIQYASLETADGKSLRVEVCGSEVQPWICSADDKSQKFTYLVSYRQDLTEDEKVTMIKSELDNLSPVQFDHATEYLLKAERGAAVKWLETYCNDHNRKLSDDASLSMAFELGHDSDQQKKYFLNAALGFALKGRFKEFSPNWATNDESLKDYIDAEVMPLKLTAEDITKYDLPCYELAEISGKKMSFKFDEGFLVRIKPEWAMGLICIQDPSLTDPAQVRLRKSEFQPDKSRYLEAPYPEYGTNLLVDGKIYQLNVTATADGLGYSAILTEGDTI